MPFPRWCYLDRALHIHAPNTGVSPHSHCGIYAYRMTVGHAGGILFRICLLCIDIEYWKYSEKKGKSEEQEYPVGTNELIRVVNRNKKQF